MPDDWSPEKAAGNLDKHGIAFESADHFDWGSSLVWADTRQDYGEVRLTALGMIGDDLFVLIFTIRRGVTWIISLRRANRKEIKRYVEETQGAH